MGDLCVRVLSYREPANMAKVGLFYGSTTGKTADAAEQVQLALGGESVVDLTDITDADASSVTI